MGEMEEQMEIEIFHDENMQSNDFDDDLMFLYDTSPGVDLPVWNPSAEHVSSQTISAISQEELPQKQPETQLDSYKTSLNSLVPEWHTEMDFFEEPLSIIPPEWKSDMKFNSYTTPNFIPKWVPEKKVASENSDQIMHSPKYVHPVEIYGYECQCVKCVGTSENSSPEVSIEESEILGPQCYIENTILGQCFKLYRLNGNKMTDELRECLANGLIQMELERVAQKNDLSPEQMLESFTISNEKFIEISAQIENTFIGENKFAYYSVNISVNGDQEETRKGFLWTEYCKKVEKLKKPDIEPTPNIEQEKCDFEPPIESNEPRNKLLDSEDITWLHKMSEPFEDVLIHWKQSYKTRRELLDDNHFSPKEYFDYFPCLQTPHAVDLLNHDFVTRYPNQTEALKTRWGIIKMVVASQLKTATTIKDPASKYLASLFPTCTPLQQDRLVMFFLPHFIKNRRAKRCETNSTCIEANRTVNSIGTRRNAFYLKIEHPSELEGKLEKVRKERFENSTHIHPLIILVTLSPEVTNHYVLWNDMLITVPSCVDAIDLTFKIMTALNLSFPELAKEIWMIIQKCGYSIDTSEPFSKSYSDFIDLFRQACVVSKVKYVL